VAAILAKLDVPFSQQGSIQLTRTDTIRSAGFLLLAALLTCGASARAEEPYATTVTIRDHRFDPSEIHVPSGKRIALTVINADPLSEEFDSAALKVEKVVAGKSQGVVHISPLSPGRYDFIGEYHESTAKGKVIAQ
jgi:plastocyanin